MWDTFVNHPVCLEMFIEIKREHIAANKLLISPAEADMTKTAVTKFLVASNKKNKTKKNNGLIACPF